MVRHRPTSPLFILALLAAACADTAAPGPASPAAGLALEVAPPTLPGLGDACYDVEVRNDLEALV